MSLLGNKVYIIFICVWIIGLYFLMTKFHFTSDDNAVSTDEVQYLKNEVEILKQKLLQIQSIQDGKSKSPKCQCQQLNEELTRVKRQLREKTDSTKIKPHGPTLEYEQLRRKIETQARELSYFTTSQLNKISEKLSDIDKNQWNNVIQRFGDQSRVLLACIRNITNVDGYQSWREREHEDLSKLMQARLKFLQNPSTPCTKVKRFTCNINKRCGYGCQIHHVMHCFHISYAVGRPMILISDRWRYNPDGFDKIFQPVSHKCTTDMVSIGSPWNYYKTADVVEIPLIDEIYPRTEFFPMAIPEDLSQRLIRLHGNPFAWFTGQLMKYLLRPQKWLTDFIKNKTETIQFVTPIVGIHVRRTDKIGTEAAFHDISEYMKYVEDYYIIYHYQNPDFPLTKRVYLATDDPSLLDDARIRYPDYIFYGDTTVARSAQVDTRYGTESLKGVLLDIHFLSLSDYLVCTFSSQICRVAYEIMQQRVVDGAWRVQPLDDVYYFGGQNPHHQRAVMSHNTTSFNEFSFERGDIIVTEGNHWDGFSKGSDKTNGHSGLYPSYKTEEVISIAKMYTYPKVKLQDSHL